MSRRSLLVMLVAVLFPPGTALSGQGHRVIEDPLACPSCSLEFSLRATLGDEEAGELSGRPVAVTADSHGRFWVVQAMTPPMVFDSEGGFLQEAGRRGEGPGESTLPRFTAAVADSVIVYDQRGVINVFGPDLNPVRQIRAPAFTYQAIDMAVVDWPRAVVFSALQRAPDQAGWPLHLVHIDGRSGVITRSFGDNDGALLPRPPNEPARIPPLLHPEELIQRRLTAGPGGDLWSIDSRNYVLTSWTPEGDQREAIRRTASWFPERSEPRDWSMSGTPERAPDPLVAGIHIDEDGRVWVYVHVPAPGWKEAWTPEILEARQAPDGVSGAFARPSGGAPTVPYPHDLYRTMVEVLDPHRGQVLARETLDGYVVGVLDDEHVAVYREATLGIPYVDVFSVTLTER